MSDPDSSPKLDRAAVFAPLEARGADRAGLELGEGNEEGRPDPEGGHAITDEQALALARLMRERTDSNLHVVRGPFDLPPGYLLVTFVVGGFTCGIAPDDRVSS